ncbi:cytochrome c1 [Fodinicurvata sp. EGI_FJ10296]|uniref:cytochrome c1 n=1 Tax=Fodinicurvata sp. EGI_FJ10296 TaxID=3231908 RepID=UPI003452ACD4
MRSLKTATLALGVAFGLIGGSALAAGEAPTPPSQNWSFEGIFGTYDRSAAQRGFQVYQEVCSSCHSMDLLDYRHLEQIGLSEEEVTAVASDYTVTDGPDGSGNMFERPAEATDSFVAPFANEAAARAANNGAYPPDLSLITKARGGGADYIYALLTGYEDPPDDVEPAPGQYYNRYFPGHLLAMPDMLSDGGVEYARSGPASVDQQAHDVSVFLAWASEPHMEDRKRMGAKVLLFLVVFTGMLYAVKRKVWSDVDH